MENRSQNRRWRWGVLPLILGAVVTVLACSQPSECVAAKRDDDNKTNRRQAADNAPAKAQEAPRRVETRPASPATGGARRSRDIETPPVRRQVATETIDRSRVQTPQRRVEVKNVDPATTNIRRDRGPEVTTKRQALPDTVEKARPQTPPQRVEVRSEVKNVVAPATGNVLRDRSPETTPAKRPNPPTTVETIKKPDIPKRAEISKNVAPTLELPKRDRNVGTENKTTERTVTERTVTERKRPTNNNVTIPERKNVTDIPALRGQDAARVKMDDVRRRLGERDRDNPSQKSNHLQRNIPGKPSDMANIVAPGKRLPSGVDRRNDLPRPPFYNQWKPGEMDRITAGETAKKVKLADQYRMAQQGDVARRLDLQSQKHGSDLAMHGNVRNDRFHHRGGDGPHFRADFYHGPVHANYRHNCVEYNYWGPRFFAGVCLYPKWQPWVDWSWRHRCVPAWDPRPIWCRPVVYDPCPDWVYWQTPVFVALPVVSCGTWVDLDPVIVAPETTDLQLVAVRFVDPGHPEERTGPRYRVWFRNNGDRRINVPFNVMLFAANGDRLMADVPQAGVRVAAIDAGEMQSVDIRLPVDVYTMGRDAQGNPAPFGVLHVLVDANREVTDVARTNNGTRLSPADILPVDPASFELDPTTARSGAEVVLAGEGFGPEPGQVLLRIGGREVQAEILGWYDLGVRWKVPRAFIAGPVGADVIVIRGDGAAANPLKITIAP